MQISTLIPNYNNDNEQIAKKYPNKHVVCASTGCNPVRNFDFKIELQTFSQFLSKINK